MKFIMTEEKITSLENVKQVVRICDAIRIDYFGGETAFIKPSKKVEISKILEEIYNELKK